MAALRIDKQSDKHKWKIYKCLLYVLCETVLGQDSLILYRSILDQKP